MTKPIRLVTVDQGRIIETKGMILPPSRGHMEDGTYLNRDDVCDLIRSYAANGAPDVPELGSQVPGWIAERIRLLG